MTYDSALFLRRALIADALISGATGLLLAVGANWLSGWLGLSTSLLRYAGLFLLPFALLVFVLGRSEAPSRRACWAVVEVNLIWVLASLWLVLANPEINGLGVFFVLFQAVAVAAFAGLQIAGLGKAATASPSRSL